MGGDAVYRTPYEALPGDVDKVIVDKVITEWRTTIRSGPWGDLPPARLVDSMPEILPRLVRLARAGATQVDDALRERGAADRRARAEGP